MNIRHRILIFIICILTCISACNAGFAASDTVYISTAAQLEAFAENFADAAYGKNTAVCLTADIDLNGAELTAIGTKENPFKLIFNGNGYTVRNFSVLPDSAYCGFFGFVQDAVIENLKIENASINPSQLVDKSVYAGILAGYNDGGRILNCSVSDSGIAFVSNGDYMLSCGGIAGLNNGVISGTSFAGKKSFDIGALDKYNEHKPNVAALNNKLGDGDNFRINFADSYAGGIAGTNRGMITNCTADSMAEAEAKYSSAASGGIAGDNLGVIEACVSKGKTVSHINISRDKGYSYAGGICGSNLNEVSGCESNAEVYSYSSVSPICADVAVDAGGICGYNASTVQNSTSSGRVRAKMRYEKDIKQVSQAGGCIGYNCGRVFGCFASGSVIGYSGYAGGIIGKNKNGTVTASGYTPVKGNSVKTDMDVRYDGNCYTDSYNRFTGGLAAVNDGGVLQRCFAEGDVNASPDRDGHSFTASGLVCINSGTVTDCYYKGTVTANSVSAFAAENIGCIRHCYSSAVLGSEPYGGMTAYIDCASNSGSIESCYSDADAFGTGGSDSAYAAASDSMKNISTYTDWDFENVWKISADENDGYPALSGGDAARIFTEGDGTETNPYRISTERELAAVSSEPDKYFVLTNDIVLNDGWQPVGTPGEPFTGTLDGNGFAVKSLSISSPLKYIGLIGCAQGAVIKNIDIEYDFEINGGSGILHIGGAAAYAENTVLENVTVSGNVKAENTNAVCGAAAGYLSGEITAAEADGSIVFSGSVSNVKCGGIAGILEGNMQSCKSTCDMRYETSDFIKNEPIVYLGGMCAVLNGNISNSAFTAESPTAAGQSGNNIITAGIAAVANGNIKNTYFSGSACGISYNGTVNGSSTNTPSALNTGMNKNAYPWIEADGNIGILRVKVMPKTSKIFDLQEISINCSEDIYYEINGRKEKYTAPFTASVGDAVNLEVLIDGVYYSLNSYFVTGRDESPMTVTSDSGSNLDNSLFDSIGKVTELRFLIKSKTDVGNTRVYVAAYDSDGIMKNIGVYTVNIAEGNNSIVADNLHFDENVTKIRIFAWGENTAPYAVDRTLIKQ